MSYEQDRDSRRDLPDTIEPTVNNGADPSILPLDGDGDQKVIDGRLDSGSEPWENEGDH